MNCEDVRPRLSAFLDAESRPDEAGRIREHLAGCPGCAAAAAALRDLVAAVGRLERDIEPDPDVWPGVAARIGGDVGRAAGSTAGTVWHRVRGRLAAWSGADRGLGRWAWRLGLGAAIVAGIVVLRDRGQREVPPDAAWEVTRLEGSPVVGDADLTEASAFGPGVWLRTDAGSRARLSALDVGRVDVGPGSEVRVLAASAKEHRIELAQGAVQAFIWAPPRLFFVETPAGVAEDLGCEYNLVVDRAGNGELEVTLGFVSFERDGREVIVPQGSRCDLRAGQGPGTPYAHRAAAALRQALERLDFTARGDAEALDAVLVHAAAGDAVTLWHLLPRTEGTDRARVTERLAALVPPPAGVTQAGVLGLDAVMLGAWWATIYPDWNLWQR